MLAWIAIVLRGFNSGGVSLREEVMSGWRAFMVRLIRTLPVC